MTVTWDNDSWHVDEDIDRVSFAAVGTHVNSLGLFEWWKRWFKLTTGYEFAVNNVSSFISFIENFQISYLLRSDS